MEWVETTGRTVEEAKDAALDQLGVDEQDAEFDVLEEPKSGLFGRLRQEARVRARVRPTTPRAKVERRDRRGRSKAVTSDDAAETGVSSAEKPVRKAAKKATKTTKATKTATKTTKTTATKTAKATKAVAVDAPADVAEEAPTKAGSPRPRGGRAAKPAVEPTGDVAVTDLDLEAQGANVRSFLEGLADAFDVEAEVSVAAVDEETLEAQMTGEDLGLLIGPKGLTLQAVQELARAILSKEGPGSARLRIDIGGYRERRREALERFSTQVAEQVLSSGEPASLEPMSPADRKVVHDTINDIEGVHTISEGEDTRRRVVVLPDGD
jgi:spoIIIJ-associated protein